MQKTIALKLSPAQAADNLLIHAAIAGSLHIDVARIAGFDTLKKSIDARGKNIYINLTVIAFVDEPTHLPLAKSTTLGKPDFAFKNVENAEQSVIIVGAGPAGIFAALMLLEKGIKPIIIERGKDVRARRRDLAMLNKTGILEPDSNYCFGEGGAGTYSDGKLYTRSHKRGDINRILQLFIQFGAPQNIGYDAHPHIGTNKLPQIISAMHLHIISCGGLVLFEQKMVDIVHDNGAIKAIVTADNKQHSANDYILATGHSARDIFSLLQQKNITIEAKPFALGVRVEHPQQLIDSIQYHCSGSRNEYLPPAAYKLVQQVNGRGVFSFCMCPGGIVAPAATDHGELVINGWSPSKRNNPYANSGIVVQVCLADALSSLQQAGIHTHANDPLVFMKFQQLIEQKAYVAGGGKFAAPAQRMQDFVQDKISTSLPKHSYIPGLTSVKLSTVLPAFIYQSLAEAFVLFGKKLKGYYSNEAVVIAVESRTSSPVRIPRQADNLQHPTLHNLYPCGEGAGYAGGIVSAAMDGERVACAIANKYNK